MGFTQDAQERPYRRSGVRVHYHWDNGTVLMPVTAPSPVTPTPAPPILDEAGNVMGPNLFDDKGNPLRQQAALVQIHAPCGYMEVDFDAERDGDYSAQPTPVRNDPNSVVRMTDIWIVSPALQADNDTRTTQVSGRYFYDLLQPIWALDGLLPYTTPQDDEFPVALDQSYFQVLQWTPKADQNNDQRSPPDDGDLYRNPNPQDLQDPANPFDEFLTNPPV